MENKSDKKSDAVISRGYFQGHQCHLAEDKLSPYEIKCGRFRKFVINLTTVYPDDIRARYIYRSYAALCAEKYRQYMYFPASLHPYSKLRVWLEVVIALSIFFSNIFLSIHFTDIEPNSKDIDYCLMYILDMVYFLNVFINFFTGYIEGDSYQRIILDLKKIASNYARSWLIFDLLSCLCFLPGLFHIPGITVHLTLVSMKILRLPILMKYSDHILTTMQTGIFKKTIVEIFLLIASYLTWNMYFQFATEYMIEGTFAPANPRKCSWVSIGKLWNNTFEVRFVYTLERSVGMLRKNTNLNLIEQEGCFESFFIVSWIIAKLLVFHCAIKYIISLFGSESAQVKYYIMTKQLENYMKQRKFPPRIKEKILKFYAIRFQSKFFVESRVLACVSGQLREDIIMHTSRQLVSELKFLRQLPRSLLLQIGLKLRIVVFISGDIIFKINTVGDCLYFIDKGTVAIYSESGKEICHLEDGDFFGEIALVLKHRFRTASAVAVTNCELFRLDKEDFDSSIACYPTVYEDIKKVATNRFERTCVLDEHHKTEIQMSEAQKYRD